MLSKEKKELMVFQKRILGLLGFFLVPCGHDDISTTGLLGLACDTSFKIHCVCASVMFVSFAIMVGYNFTRSGDGSVMTPEKKLRNKIYQICACVIVVFMVNQVLAATCGYPGYWTLINEAIMLWAFSFAWLVKAEFFTMFNDKKL
jgi:hypothetical protein